MDGLTISETDCNRRKTEGTANYFNCLGSVITNVARCTREIKSKIATAKTEFNKKTVIASPLDLNLRKKLVKCYI
jgi:CRISPR/Cas system-associated protein Cas10 (large subunit of type III CRISPR-Cas system)